MIMEITEMKEKKMQHNASVVCRKKNQQKNELGKKKIKDSIQNNFPKTKEVTNYQFKRTSNPRKNKHRSINIFFK